MENIKEVFNYIKDVVKKNYREENVEDSFEDIYEKVKRGEYNIERVGRYEK